MPCGQPVCDLTAAIDLAQGARLPDQVIAVAEEAAVTIWRLIPIDLDDPSWLTSSHRGPAVVRARDENTARQTAQEAFGLPQRFRPGKGTPVPPWKRPEHVRAERLEASIYPADGPAEVLEPSFAADLPRKEREG
jgi:hypothetical protein